MLTTCDGPSLDDPYEDDTTVCGREAYGQEHCWFAFCPAHGGPTKEEAEQSDSQPEVEV